MSGNNFILKAWVDYKIFIVLVIDPGFCGRGQNQATVYLVPVLTLAVLFCSIL